ncbi:MAG: TetR/AcrR family transcriptional regulator [Chloroflexota bacterium]
MTVSIVNLDAVNDKQHMSKNITKTKPRKLDRRVVRTRKMLAAALLDLMQEKNFEEITITDIAERADMNRATFYLHYGTKEELLYKSLEERFDQLVTSIEEQMQVPENGYIWEEDTYDRLVFEHVAEHADLYKVILDQNGMGAVIHRIIDYIAAVAYRTTLNNVPENFEAQIPMEIISRHVAGSMFSLLVWWIRNDLPYSPTEMARMCHHLVSFGCAPDFMRK